MLNFFDSVSCETIIAENEAYEQVLAMVRLQKIHYMIIKELRDFYAEVANNMS